MKKTRQLVPGDRRGALLPMLATVMVALMVIVFLGVDIARMHLTRSELRTANDAAARAAVEALGRTQDTTSAVNAAIAIGARNEVAGKALTLRSAQISLGSAREGSDGKFIFTSGGSILTSARVSGNRTVNSPDGPVGLLFGPLFGVNEFLVSSTSTATQTQRDVALVLDVSGSMNSEGRFLALAQAVDSFLDVLGQTPQEERVSLCVYESTSRKPQALTADLNAIRDAFSFEQPSGSTAIGLGLAQGLQSLQNDANARPFAFKSIILMTDGNHNTDIDPETIAQRCADGNVSISTVTFKEGADQQRMENIAEIAGGTFIHADDNNDLIKAFRSMAKQLSVSLIE